MVAAALAVCSAVVLGPLTDLRHLDLPAVWASAWLGLCQHHGVDLDPWRVHAESPTLLAVRSREFDGDARLGDAEGAGLGAALVEPEGRIGVGHQTGVGRHPQ